MPLNRQIEIGMTADTRSFTRDIYSAVDALKALKTGVSAANDSVARFHLPGASLSSTNTPPAVSPQSDAGGVDNSALGGAASVAAKASSAIAAIGPQMATSIQGGLSTVQSQLNLVGGVVEHLAHRIESSMRFTGLKTSLMELQAQIQGAVTTASATAVASQTRLQAATLALGPAAQKAISAYLGFAKVRNFFDSLRSSSLSAAKLSSQFQQMTTPVGAVTARVQSLSRQIALTVAGMGAAVAATLAIGPAAGSVVTSFVGFAKIRQILAGNSASAAQFRGQLHSTPPAVNRVTNSVRGLGLQIGLALGVVGLAYKATTAIVGFFKSGISGANDLNETMNKVKETFGEQSGVVTGLADELGSKFGLVKGPILDAASSFGLIGKGAGLSAQEAAKMSASLTKLAADATSFYHKPMEDSLGKIKAGLVGESKPLRDFGVQMDEAAVKQEALRLGLSKGKGDLDNHAEIMARASLITKGLATASGDLERTQNDTANQFLKAGGGIQNFATTIGTMLLPTVKVAVGAFNELLASLITVFEDNKPMIQGWADGLKGAFDGAAMILRNAGDYWTIFKLQTIENLSNVLAYIETIPPNLGLLATYVDGNWRQIIWDGVNAVGTIFQNLGTNLGELANSIYQFFKDPMGGFVFNWTPLLEGFKATAAALPELIKPELISLQDEIFAAGQRIEDREKLRAIRLNNILPGPKKPEAVEEMPEPKPGEYKSTAAVELGSSEAASALARFFNQSGDTDAKQTAAATKETAKHTKNAAQALKEIATRANAQAQGLGMFPI